MDDQNERTPNVIINARENSMVFQRESNKSRSKKLMINSEYNFDAILSPHKNQIEVFETIGKSLLENLMMDRINSGMLFAYGYTNSGKTFSILGVNSEILKCENEDSFRKMETLGMFPRMLQQLVNLKKHNRQEGESWVENIKVSAFEVYKERIFDLLGEEEAGKLEINRKSNKRMEITRKFGKLNFIENHILDSKDIKECITRSEKVRTTDDNGINQFSSRSHAVYRIRFMKCLTKKGNAPKNQIINEEERDCNIQYMQKEIYVIDLAGAEKPNPGFINGRSLSQSGYQRKPKFQFKNDLGTRSASKFQMYNKAKSESLSNYGTC